MAKIRQWYILFTILDHFYFYSMTHFTPPPPQKRFDNPPKKTEYMSLPFSEPLSPLILKYCLIESSYMQPSTSTRWMKDVTFATDSMCITLAAYHERGAIEA